MDTYEEQYRGLTESQRVAVDWDGGPLLVLAGPGSGKTRVLTSRIARILRESPDKSFRVLGLTFTNKAANEMQERLHQLCDGLEDRAQVGTFHSFCMQMLQQHGSHIGVPSDFSIYSQEEDRRELLKDGLRRLSGPLSGDASLVRYLQLIDKLKGLLIDVPQAAAKFKDPEEGRNVAIVYEAYEAELARANALDFNSLMLRAYQLVQSYDGIATRYRKTYRHWLIDEFQDTNRAQYKFIKALAGDTFKNIFAVADDDQIIYQWNGASFQQLQRFRADFQPELLQLPTNYRCPPPIVNAANNLVRHNTTRTDSKLPLVAGKLQTVIPHEQSILIGVYDTDQDEANAVADMILSRPNAWSETVVIGRNKSLLDKVCDALKLRSVSCAISQRRDDFVSPEFCWLHRVLRQVIRPQDQRNFQYLVNAFNRWQSTKLSSDLLVSLAEGSTRSLLDEWIFQLTASDDSQLIQLSQMAQELALNHAAYHSFAERSISLFNLSEDGTGDVDEDFRAWKALKRSIISSYGQGLSLEQFLQHVALQSKEPPLPSNTVSLMTIHAAKGKEFDFVYLLGLAEQVLPSFQSLKAGDNSQELEEERRNCFVAITRAKEQLILTRAERYRGYKKAPSRFLMEMGIVSG